jgi:hypothetical protein
MGSWEIVLDEAVDAWFLELAKTDPDTAAQVEAAINLLEQNGPALGRPVVDRVKGSTLHNLKELRPGSAGGTEIRILFIFDPLRQAILLAAGDKAGDWTGWYRTNIPIAEERYARHLEELEGQPHGDEEVARRPRRRKSRP